MLCSVRPHLNLRPSPSLSDNSSRFGKWVALRFTSTGVACGGSITTYLLESVRVTRQMKAERNFHAFHQLLAAAAQAISHRPRTDLAPIS